MMLYVVGCAQYDETKDVCVCVGCFSIKDLLYMRFLRS